jgi:PIN domain nuclease of toxin-antitoxin system
MLDLECEELPLFVRHNAAYMRIPREQHRNPHDQLIMAQAMTEQIILVTSDKDMRRYDLPDLQVLC